MSQVAHDTSLLRERVGKLGGPAGLARMEAALAAVRQRVLAEMAEDAAARAAAGMDDTESEADRY